MLMFRVEFSVAMQPPNCTQISITFCHASETKPNIMFWLISFVISIIFIWRKKCRIIVSHYAVHIQWLSLCVCSFAICILLFFFSSFRWFLNVHRFFFFLVKILPLWWFFYAAAIGGGSSIELLSSVYTCRCARAIGNHTGLYRAEATEKLIRN